MFGTIYAEAQRRYFESVAPYARRLIHQVGAPKVAEITGWTVSGPDDPSVTRTQPAVSCRTGLPARKAAMSSTAWV
ncbi:hypothetical protein [Streptomyces sp. YKOK-I1]